MKKLLTLCLALIMMAALCLPTYAVVSPEADVITTTTPSQIPGGNTSSTAPQTGHAWIVLVAGVAVASIAAACVVSKKLTAEN